MADIRKLAPLVFKLDGELVAGAVKAAGPFNMGVTMNTLIRAGLDKESSDKHSISPSMCESDMVFCFLKPFYWDKWHADHIKNQSIANILVDWLWVSGKPGINIPLKVLGIKAEGVVDKQTIQTLNEYPNQQYLFDQIKKERRMFIEKICATRQSNQRFKSEWLKRLDDFLFI